MLSAQSNIHSLPPHQKAEIIKSAERLASVSAILQISNDGAWEFREIWGQDAISYETEMFSLIKQYDPMADPPEINRQQGAGRVRMSGTCDLKNGKYPIRGLDHGWDLTFDGYFKRSGSKLIMIKVDTASEIPFRRDDGS